MMREMRKYCFLFCLLPGVVCCSLNENAIDPDAYERRTANAELSKDFGHVIRQKGITHIHLIYDKDNTVWIRFRKQNNKIQKITIKQLPFRSMTYKNDLLNLLNFAGQHNFCILQDNVKEALSESHAVLYDKQSIIPKRKNTDEPNEAPLPVLMPEGVPIIHGYEPEQKHLGKLNKLFSVKNIADIHNNRIVVQAWQLQINDTKFKPTNKRLRKEKFFEPRFIKPQLQCMARPDFANYLVFFCLNGQELPITELTATQLIKLQIFAVKENNGFYSSYIDTLLDMGWYKDE